MKYRRYEGTSPIGLVNEFVIGYINKDECGNETFNKSITIKCLKQDYIDKANYDNDMDEFERILSNMMGRKR